MRVQLTQEEVAVLALPVNGQGGYQSLLRRLQKHLNARTNELELTPTQLERIARYAFNYGQGGWEDRLVDTFGRALGKGLGRENYGY